jgi:hypothetical protein
VTWAAEIVVVVGWVEAEIEVEAAAAAVVVLEETQTVEDCLDGTR